MLDCQNTCPICLMVYNPTNKSDANSHKKYHERYISGILPGRIVETDILRANGKLIVHVNQSSRASLVKLVHKVIDRAARDIGEAPPLPRQWTCYLAYDKLIVGFVLIEPNVRASLASKPEKIVACPMGVLRMWVVTKERRKGWCRYLLDAARHHSDIPVSLMQVAFSDPTDDGLAFARAYCGTEPLIYQIIMY